MTASKAKVAVALSGGVDSAAATALLLETGYECFGLFMITSDRNRHAQEEAAEAAEKLGVELRVLDLRPQFEQILDYFCDEYARGRTPNPCVVCNRLIKFGALWDFAEEAGAKFLATGHYARILMRDGQPALCQGLDTGKDQSYVLSMVRPDVLRHVLLPMGQHTKSEARRIARELGLNVDEKAESQEICFVPNDAYVPFLEQRRPSLACEGPIIDSAGNVLGTHEGVHRYTVGQRRGLRVAMGKPYYVTGLNAATNTVILGPKEEVMHRRLRATNINWLMDRPHGALAATVKVRYNDPGHPATITPDGHDVQVGFQEPIAAITPGQLAVFYVAEAKMRRVIGAGWIDKVEDG